MGNRLPNPRRVKTLRTYDVTEAARQLGVHKNTVRHWLQDGLVAIDSRRPTLILGSALREFLEARRAKLKQRCPPGHFYCVACRAPKAPALQMADYLPFTPETGNLRGLCPDCNRFIHRRVALAKIDLVRGDLDVSFPQALPRVGESGSPTVNCDFEKES